MKNLYYYKNYVVSPLVRVQVSDSNELFLKKDKKSFFLVRGQGTCPLKSRVFFYALSKKQNNFF